MLRGRRLEFLCFCIFQQEENHHHCLYTVGSGQGYCGTQEVDREKKTIYLGKAWMLLTLTMVVFFFFLLLILLNNLIHALSLISWPLVGESMMNLNIWKGVCVTADGVVGSPDIRAQCEFFFSVAEIPS